MELKVYPGYEDHVFSYLKDDSPETEKHRKAQGEAIIAYTLPDDMKMENRVIKGGDGQDMNIRIFTPENVKTPAPMILEIHGGGFVGGNLEIDNARCIALASRVPAIVVCAEYRLSGKDAHFPQPLMDCHAAYQWMQDHADKIGGDKERIGLHGSSAGGTLCAGLSLYLRDKGELQPKLTVTNCAAFSTAIEETRSYHQLHQLRMDFGVKHAGAETAYLGGYDGTQPSYYAFPLFCHDLGGLNPHLVIAAEYDTLRDGSFQYARRLLDTGVPTDFFMGGRVGHCFTAAPHPYTNLTHDVIAAAFQREFGLLDHLKK